MLVGIAMQATEHLATSTVKTCAGGKERVTSCTGLHRVSGQGHTYWRAHVPVSPTFLRHTKHRFLFGVF